MSSVMHTNAVLIGFGYPIFPNRLNELRLIKNEYGINNFSFLESIGKLIPEFVSADQYPYTSDGYHWFCRLDFAQENGRVAILFPWCQDFGATDKDYSDRSIAIYITGYVNVDLIISQLIEAIKSFGEAEQKRIQAYFKESRQRHHDYIVFQYRESGGNLSWMMQMEYDLALAREEKGFVDPLPENAINYFKVEQEKQKESKE